MGIYSLKNAVFLGSILLFTGCTWIYICTRNIFTLKDTGGHIIEYIVIDIFGVLYLLVGALTIFFSILCRKKNLSQGTIKFGSTITGVALVLVIFLTIAVLWIVVINIVDN